MIEQEAIVARVEGDQAYIEVGGQGSGCGRCHEAGGCQSGLLTQLFRPGPRHFRIDNRIGAEPGERVVVRVAEGATLRAALLVYLIPVLFLVAGAFAGTALGGGSASADGAALLGALLGLGAGALVSFALRKGRPGKAMQPLLVRKGSTNCTAKEACR
ncbi:MAG: SoxR reducing system RseC family protein [Rhodocyclales bacterium]|nr:SoxR reducing system RseC family protein [Rhodocyclales bacterium]